MNIDAARALLGLPTSFSAHDIELAFRQTSLALDQTATTYSEQQRDIITARDLLMGYLDPQAHHRSLIGTTATTVLEALEKREDIREQSKARRRRVDKTIELALSEMRTPITRIQIAAWSLSGMLAALTALSNVDHTLFLSLIGQTDRSPHLREIDDEIRKQRERLSELENSIGPPPSVLEIQEPNQALTSDSAETESDEVADQSYSAAEVYDVLQNIIKKMLDSRLVFDDLYPGQYDDLQPIGDNLPCYAPAASQLPTPGSAVDNWLSSFVNWCGMVKRSIYTMASAINERAYIGYYQSSYRDIGRYLRITVIGMFIWALFISGIIQFKKRRMDASIGWIRTNIQTADVFYDLVTSIFGGRSTAGWLPADGLMAVRKWCRSQRRSLLPFQFGEGEESGENEDVWRIKQFVGKSLGEGTFCRMMIEVGSAHKFLVSEVRESEGRAMVVYRLNVRPEGPAV